MSPALAPHNWSNSGMFLQTHRMANYTTNVSDYGPHNVTLTVKDESGLFDYQVVKILVFDLPVANISKIKIYNDIPENIASVEDMLPLDGSASRGSIIMGGSITNYIWTIFWWNAAIPDWQSVFYNKSSNPLITIPTEFSTIITDKNILIQKIKPLNLSNVGIHNVTLVVESNIPLTNQPVYSVPVGVGVNVTECVPHHNTTLIYPYNAVTTDPFTANHTCCTGTTGSLLDQATVFKRKTTFDICYMTSLYGELEKLRTQSTNPTLTKISELANYQYTFSLTQSPPPGVFPTGGKYNDVYNLTFDRNCDGNRGNICAGPMFATYTVLWPCTAKGTLNEACTGPDQITNIAPAGCTKYGFGTTFEKTFNPSTGTGICNTARTCSTPGVGGYGASTGKAYCQGTCDGSGVCAGAWNCLCSKSACGAAQCDAAYSFEWAVGSTMCKSNCNLNPTLSNMCSFGSSNQIYCTPPSNNYQGTVGCLSGEYCRISHCDANGGGALQGDKCVKGETFPGTGAQAGKTCCIYWPSQIPPSPLCTSAGICNFNKDCRANVTGLSCNPSSGWT